MSHTSPHILDVTAETFDRDVLERSRTVPVVIDFWAAWCGPCRMLAPVLERLAVEYDGRFVLAKVDTEAAPELAAGFSVNSIPAVFGLRDGRVIDSFTGVLGESAIRSFLERLMPDPAEQLAIEADALAASDPEAAVAKYRAALDQDSHLARARIGLGRVLLQRGRIEEALAQVQALERRGYLEPEAETLKAELILESGGREAGGLEAARAAVAADPGNLTLQFQLAEALASARLYDEALAVALDLVERDRRGVGEPARQLMLAVFNVLPPESAVVADFRRRLSLVL